MHPPTIACQADPDTGHRGGLGITASGPGARGGRGPRLSGTMVPASGVSG